MKKRVFYTEVAYLLGLLLIAMGVALMEKANFGVSMIVAPAYVLHRWLSPTLPWFTFGVAEYCLQGLLLLLMGLLLRRFRLSWLLSFATAVLYGIVLDGLMLAAAALPASLGWRVGWYILGMLLSSAGVACMFHTYLSPEVYELLVKECAAQFRVPIHRFKTGYDCVSCLVALLMSFACFGFGQFVGVRWGTVVCALINGWLIGRCSAWMDNTFTFRDRLPWRPFFEGDGKLKPAKQSQA